MKKAANIDENETYLVVTNVKTNIIKRHKVTKGDNTKITPKPVATPFPPFKLK